jgi:hypothetical protein
MADFSPTDVQQHLSGLQYPASKDDVLTTAQQQGMEETLLERLRENLSSNTYESPADVMSELRGAL